jgi:hypothetical protein
MDDFNCGISSQLLDKGRANPSRRAKNADSNR